MAADTFVLVDFQIHAIVIHNKFLLMVFFDKLNPISGKNQLIFPFFGVWYIDIFRLYYFEVINVFK